MLSMVSSACFIFSYFPIIVKKFCLSTGCNITVFVAVWIDFVLHPFLPIRYPIFSTGTSTIFSVKKLFELIFFRLSFCIPCHVFSCIFVILLSLCSPSGCFLTRFWWVFARLEFSANDLTSYFFTFFGSVPLFTVTVFSHTFLMPT